MASIVKILSSEINGLKRRIVKFLRFGLSDVQTSIEVGPFGIDSSPIKGMRAIYSETNEKGRTVIVGYINENQLAEPGEFRAYSVDENGIVKTYTWLKKDGTIELGGNQDNLVRWSKLDEELKNFATFMNQQFSLIASGISTGGGAYTPGNAEIDISDAKIEEIKTL